MRSLVQRWRMKAWRQIDVAEYSNAYEQFGGSVLSSPIAVQAISATVSLPVDYYGYYQGEQLLAAIPVWGRWIAGSKKSFKKMGRKGVVDMGNSELILPISPDAKIFIPVKAENVSSSHSENIVNLKESGVTLCMAKPHGAGGLSKKFRYNQRRALRLLEEAGAVVKEVKLLTNREIAENYKMLFEKRWGFKATGHERLEAFLEGMRPLLFGSFIEFEGKAIAFQLIYKSESANHISVEFINGGVDPIYQKFSPGSAITFVNTAEAWALSDSQGKSLRYSFGKADAAYKEMWCSHTPVFNL